MSRGPETASDPPGPPAVRVLAWCVVLAILAGCQNASPRGPVPDPLVTSSIGSVPAGGSAPAPAASGAPATAGTTNGVPPLAATTSLPSNAALAGGGAPGPAPDDGRNALRMQASPTSNPAPAPSSGGATPGWPQNPSPSPSVSALQPPEAPAGTERLAPVAATPVPLVPFPYTSAGAPAAGGPPATDTYLQLQEMLRVRGVTVQRLETSGNAGDWKFRCSIPNKQNPSIERRYEAKVPGDYGLAAIRAVIEKIDKDVGGSAAGR